MIHPQHDQKKTIKAGVEIMLSAVRGIPDHLVRGGQLVVGVHSKITQPIARVTLCALGGSAFPGEFIKWMTDAHDVPFSISRSYRVERGKVSARDLIIASSFSGNTEETLSSLEDALERGAQVVTVCAGGQLERWSIERDLPMVKLHKPTEQFQPRAASGYFLGVISGLLEDLGLIKCARTRLAQVAAELKGLMDVTEEARTIASALHERIPVFYASPPYAESLARVAKIKVNENAKCPAFWNEIPEFNHNEMVGYTRLHHPLTAVFFDDPLASPRMRQRVTQSVGTLKEYGVDTLVIPIRSAQDPLTSLLATLYLLDEVSCELAVQSGVDPNPVTMIEEFKAALGPS